MSRYLISLGAALLLGSLILVTLETASVHALWSALIGQLLEWQRHFQRGLTMAMMALSERATSSTWLSLIGLSFGYGIFHALGPGHGKAVMTTYMLTQRAALRRGIAMSIAAALLQGFMAVIIMSVLVFGLGWLTRQAMGSVRPVEQASFVMVVVLGVWLCVRALRQLWQLQRRDSHSRGDSPAAQVLPASGSEALTFSVATSPRPAFGVTNDHTHDAMCGCGHAHHIDPASVGHSWRDAAVAVLAIGLRPCSGAILMLGAASLLGHWGAGVLAVMAMSAGTAITIATLATLSVVARGWMRRLASHERRWMGYATQAIALIGGLVIVALGIGLLFAGGSAPPPSFLG
ncbi:nickel/cobalt transporter [Phytohalomonas tamaricis]|uniref:nickel/cobalt transporter n=1 Tax=Phytohalomonas tamaricis TaxID=2081032 RepID=UPI000D0ABF17|nr:nickel/cobalt transporter [Phytohalomonas tamaricis]